MRRLSKLGNSLNQCTFSPLWIAVCKKQKVIVYLKDDYYGNFLWLVHCNGQFIGLSVCSLCQQCQHLNKSEDQLII